METVLKLEDYPAELVVQLAQEKQLLGFEEVLPSVGEIFIDIVENGPKA